ncbi:D-amino acid dehydrogenase [Denitromonas iodatirespirans]|uniref:D-amino acid dehydrogenase n=1 Tax=Denitromonas iodatirespirans TaxID=2795389 RepID=A0A944H9I2_DENI1|nr:D-amino acid dehydrogenase [Denitromonas iodatirespirans]MBT0963264.1 D-amino acid dehydrogenase [Denitromonas iodatirespirans]
MHITVIGAGIVGLATAWFLRQDGHSVTVIDRRETVGQGTSQANGGQLSYRYIAPLADPDVLPKVPGWMLQADSPIRFQPRFDRDQWRWIASFMKACNANDKQRTVAALLPLSLLSQRLVHDWVTTEALDFDFRHKGKLVVYRDAAGFRSARTLIESRPELASQQHALDRAACLALEPAIAGMGADVVGGIHTPSEDVGDCFKLCQALARRMGEGANPVRFHLGHLVESLIVSGGRVVALRTDRGDIPTDACVAAGGVEAVALLRPLGIEVPVYPLKGYSISAPIADPAKVPDISITDYQRKIVYARLGAQLRVAGMADIVGHDESLQADRLATLIRETRQNFGDGVQLDTVAPWAGLRPATPTGRPVVDATALPNLWLNLGHGALGFTLAAGCARLVADRIAGRPRAVPDEEFTLAHSGASGWRKAVGASSR